MCRSMADIHSTAAEIRRGKKDRRRKKERRKETTGQKYNGPLLHRAAIKRVHSRQRGTLPDSSSLCEALRQRQLNLIKPANDRRRRAQVSI